MRGAIPSLPSTPPWRGVQLKHRDNFIFTHGVREYFHDIQHYQNNHYFQFLAVQTLGELRPKIYLPALTATFPKSPPSAFWESITSLWRWRQQCPPKRLFYSTNTRHHNPEVRDFKLHRRANPKCRFWTFLSDFMSHLETLTCPM